MISNFIRIVAGAAGGGLLTLTIINAGTRKRSRRANKAIIGLLCDLSINIYLNFEHGKVRTSSHDQFILNLESGASKDVSSDIETIEYRLWKQAHSMSDEEFYSSPYKQKIIYNIKDLCIYFRDAFYNANNENDLDLLDHVNRWGLNLIGSLEGWGASPVDALSKDQLSLLCFFFEICIPLYKSLLIKRCVPVIVNDDRIEREWQKPHA
jgi:hypothetical protein